MRRRFHLLLLRVFQHLPRRARLAVVHLAGPSFTVGAICVIERADGRYLLVRHSYRRNWGFPGGLLKRGEEIEDGAVREVMEEVGLDVDLQGEPAVVVAPGPRRVDVIYRCRPVADADCDRLRPRSAEILELRWFAQDELPDLQTEAAEALVALARVTAQAMSSELH